MNQETMSVTTLPKHRWKVLGLGVAANTCFSMIIGGLPAAAVLLRSSYMLSNADLGFILSMMGLGVALSELPWGMLTDKWGDRPVLLMGLTGTAIVALLMAVIAVPHPDSIPSLLCMTLCVLAIGLIGSSVNGSSGRAIMSWFTESERGFAMSIRQTAVPMGYGLGALFFPFIASHFGFAVLYSISGCILLVCAFFTWLWLYEPDQHKTQASTSSQPDTISHQSPLKNVHIWKIVSAIGILCAPQFVLLTFGAVFLHDFGNISVSVSSVSLATIQIGAMVTRIWSGRWTDKHQNRKSYLKTCSMLSIVSFLVLSFSVVMWTEKTSQETLIFSVLLVAVFIVSGILVSAWHGVAYTELAAMAEPKYVGTALAMGNTVVFIVLFVTPLAVPYLEKNISWAAVWVASTICACIAFVCFPTPQNRQSDLQKVTGL